MLIDYKMPNAHVSNFRGESLLWSPGVNQVSDEAWAELSKTQDISRMVTAKQIVIVSQKASDDLNAVTPAKGIEIVKKTFDKKLLEGWAKNVKSPTVGDAIKDQIALVYVPEKEVKEG